jgi:uncharacterized membrane protein YbjE (DUF340 family)
MYIFISLMLLGVLIGLSLKNYRIKKINLFISTFIWILLFLLGIEIGANPAIINNIGFIGLDALFIAIAEVLGSALAAALLWKSIKKLHHER